MRENLLKAFSFLSVFSYPALGYFFYPSRQFQSLEFFVKD
jgi:hypothetical protein